MLKKAEIISALCDGFVEASDTYIDWSGGNTIHDAGIEYLATVTIAKKIVEAARKSDQDSWVYLEMPFEDVREHCEDSPRRGRRPPEFSGRPRVDIAYFDRTDRVRG